MLRSTPLRRLLSTLPNTSAVRAGHELNTTALLPLLTSANIDVNNLTISQFAHGQSNPTYVLQSDSGKYVLRKKPAGKLLRGAHAVDREAKIMTALKDTNIPVPNVRLYENDVSILGTEFYVYDYVEADFHKDCTLKNVPTAADRAAIYTDIIQTTANLHTVDYDAVGLGEYGKVGGYLKRQIKVWTAQYEAAKAANPDADTKSMDYLKDFLPTAIPEDDVTSIVHGDIRVDNMLFKDNKVEGEFRHVLFVPTYPLCSHIYTPTCSRRRLGAVHPRAPRHRPRPPLHPLPHTLLHAHPRRTRGRERP